MSSEHHITYQTKGRFYLHGDPTKAKKLLIVLHGYGYLAQYFIRKFKHIENEDICVLCPEAPHRFYQAGTNGRVGASWMTKEDRLTDIENYISFLDATLSHLKSQHTFESFHLIGFSQGGATASRWLAYGAHQFDTFTLWATVFPPDMEKSYHPKINQSRNYFVFGTKDEYYTLEKVNEHFDEIQNKGLNFQMLNFEGGHDIDRETLDKLLHEI